MIQTERLLMRGWREDDVEPFAAMCRDTDVMAFLGPSQDELQVREAIARQEAIRARTGHCFWAIERRADGAFLGFCGLQPGPAGTPIAGDIEIGWRLARAVWGQGVAREAAAACLDWAWARGVPRVAAITVPENVRSRGLMERLGMVRAAGEDFDHPAVAEGDSLQWHVVYRIERPHVP